MHDGTPLAQTLTLTRGRRLVALTGAGCSTESGIPDYRGPGTLQRARSPVRFASFASDPVAYRRYWARSFVGWPRLAQARPNAAHQALAHGGRRHQKGRADGRRIQAEQRLQHQRCAQRRVDGRVGAGEHQRQPAVGDLVALAGDGDLGVGVAPFAVVGVADGVE